MRDAGISRRAVLSAAGIGAAAWAAPVLTTVDMAHAAVGSPPPGTPGGANPVTGYLLWSGKLETDYQSLKKETVVNIPLGKTGGYYLTRYNGITNATPTVGASFWAWVDGTIRNMSLTHGTVIGGTSMTPGTHTLRIEWNTWYGNVGVDYEVWFIV